MGERWKEREEEREIEREREREGEKKDGKISSNYENTHSQCKCCFDEFHYSVCHTICYFSSKFDK